MDSELHVLAYRNTLLANEEGRYVLGHLLARLNFFTPCESVAEMELRNVAIEMLEDLGILFIEKADNANMQKSMMQFVDAIAKLDVMPLVDGQAKDNENKQDNVF